MAGQAEWYVQVKDSLIGVIATQRGAKKVESYKQLFYEIYSNEQNLDTIRAYYRLVKAHIPSGDSQAQYALFAQYLSALFNKGEYDEGLQLALPWLERMPKNDNYFSLYLDVLNIYQQKGMYQTELEEVNKMYNEAKTVGSDLGRIASLYTMGNVYAAMRRHKEAIDYFHQCIALAKEGGRYSELLLYAYDSLCDELNYEKRFQEQADLLPGWLQLIERAERTNKHSSPLARFMFYERAAAVHISLGKIDEAENYVRMARQVTNNPGLKGISQYYSALISESRGHYEQALEEVNESYATAKEMGQSSAIPDMLDAKLRILIKTGTHNQEIYPLYQFIKARNDSLYLQDAQKQINELNTIYKVDKIKADRERTRYHLTLALAGCALLLIVMGVWGYHSRRILRKNKILYLQIKEQARLTQKLNQTIAEISRKMPMPSAANNQTEEGMSLPDGEASSEHKLWQENLVSQLSDYLLENKRFADADRINDEELAAALFTNRTSLRDAVKNVTGETLLEFVHDLQLEEARRLLESKYDWKIESIAVDCGLSMTTFYRLFQQKYHISPAQYRKMSKIA
jgi:AraC-like DNA-binding protein